MCKALKKSGWKQIKNCSVIYYWCYIGCFNYIIQIMCCGQGCEKDITIISRDCAAGRFCIRCAIYLEGSGMTTEEQKQLHLSLLCFFPLFFFLSFRDDEELSQLWRKTKHFKYNNCLFLKILASSTRRTNQETIRQKNSLLALQFYLQQRKTNQQFSS